jgi:hypothetical protein
MGIYCRNIANEIFVRAECPYYRKKKPSVVWASLPAIPVGLGKNSAGRMPILQKEKTIGSVGIPARSTGGFPTEIAHNTPTRQTRIKT